MTTRLAMAVVLLLMLLVQAWGLVAVWRDDPLRSLAAPGKKEAKVQAPMPGGRLSLQPVPGALPDLNQGYLFNAERNLAAGGKDGQSRSAGNVGMDKVQYNGSIISKDNTRALLSYPLGSPVGLKTQGFLRVVVGDTVDGYKVTEILPEKIIFSRGGQKITKLLYDKNKERIQAQPLMPGSEAGMQAPVPPPVQAPAASSARKALKQNDKPRILPPPKRPYPAPSDEELRKTPLRKRPEPAKDAPASDADVLVPDEYRGTAPAPPGTKPK
ncbi:MAG TPA: hypothetical protein VGA28_02635 [Desulfurivibrionaceae bacterium]|jgi:hypothetical protein